MEKINLEQIMYLMIQNTGYFGLRGASKHDLELLKHDEYLDASPGLAGTSAFFVTEYMRLAELKEIYSLAKNYADNYDTGIVLLIYGTYGEYNSSAGEFVISCDFENGAKAIAEVIL